MLPIPPLITISVFRRNYGLRYTDLPVDHRDEHDVLIDCTGNYTRPTHYDLRPGDLVRWKHEDRFLEAVIQTVSREPEAVRVRLTGAHLLPEDFFPY